MKWPHVGVFGWPPGASGYATTTVNTPTQRPVTIMVDIDGNDIYMKSAVPLNVIHAYVGPDAFSGQIRVNMLDKPTFRIDRMTGAMNISGNQVSFNGSCHRVEQQQQQF